MNKWIIMLLLAGFASCSMRSELGLGAEDEDFTNGLLALAAGTLGANPPCPGVRVLSGTISTSLTTGTCVLLTGSVFVGSGATLTFPAGAQVYADSGAALFILKGGKINATGTASNPVVFTSAQPQGTRASGDWGGIVIIGNAPTNQPAKSTEGAFPQTYGGPSSNVSDDNSGVLSYVRIEYAGYAVTTNSELNCLSLYAVGSGTTLDHIQCHMGRDDSFEIWGGRANAKFLLSTGCADDDFDFDEGYVGKMQFLIAIRYGGNAGAGSTDPRGFEWNGTCNAPCSNAGGASSEYSTVKIANMTLIGPGATPYAGNSSAPGGPAGRARVQMNATISHASGTSWGAAGNNGAWQSNDAGTVLTLSHIISDAGNSATSGGGVVNGTVTTGTYNGTTTLPLTLPFTPAGSFVGPTSNTGFNLQPTGTVPAVANLNTISGFSGDSFFTANTTPHGMLTGQDWTAGWVRFSYQ